MPMMDRRARIGLCLAMIGATLAMNLRGAQSFSTELAQLQERLAAQPTNAALLFQIGDLCYDQGAEGDTKAVELAEQYLTRLLRVQPEHAMGMALLGSAVTMKARDAFWPNVRFRYAREGIRIMDAAVKLAPENADVRFVRAENNFHMPGFMNREEIAREDLQWLWDQVQSRPEAFTNHFKQKVSYYQGLSLKNQKQSAAAVKVWEYGLQLNPNSRWGRDIRKVLN
jgi:tetratricopeptide (TPR) repeat protein